MFNIMSPETLLSRLRAAAILRYGEKRAAALDEAIREIAQSMAVVADYEMPQEQEPAFFL